jgi:molecular chaperone HtpG
MSPRILQESKDIETIRAGAVKKVLGLLEDLAQSEQDEEKQNTKHFGKFGQVIKEGVADSHTNRERIIGAALRDNAYRY